MSPDALTADYRRVQRAVGALTEHDLRALWRKLDLRNPDLVRVIAPPLVREVIVTRGEVAAVAAADYYALARETARAPGEVDVEPAVVIEDDEQVDALVGWALSPMYDANPSPAAAFSLLAGGGVRLVRNAGRQTIYGTVGRDPYAMFMRQTSAGACEFCSGLAGAPFSGPAAGPYVAAFHDHCNCDVVPLFG